MHFSFRPFCRGVLLCAALSLAAHGAETAKQPVAELSPGDAVVLGVVEGVTEVVVDVEDVVEGVISDGTESRCGRGGPVVSVEGRLWEVWERGTFSFCTGCSPAHAIFLCRCWLFEIAKN